MKLNGFPKVRKLNSPYEAGHADLISDDRHSVMITFSPKGDYDEAVTYIQTIEAGMNEVAKSNPDFYVDELGSVDTERELEVVFGGMLKTAGMIAIPIALVILLLVFGSAVAALVPLVLALTAVFATMSLVALPSQFFPMDEQISEVILLIGLAVGIDYSLFYLKREREERAAGRSEGAALAAAAATSGRAVLVSGFTVLVAMAGMFLSGDKTFMSFSVGTMLVVLVAMIGSLDRASRPPREAWRQGREGSDPVRASPAAQGRRRASLGSNPRPCPPPAGRLDCRCHRRPRRPCTAGARPQDGQPRHGRHQHRRG